VFGWLRKEVAPVRVPFSIQCDEVLVTCRGAEIVVTHVSITVSVSVHVCML